MSIIPAYRQDALSPEYQRERISGRDNQLVEHVPDEIATREPYEFGDWCGVDAKRLDDLARD